ncbi:MAG TPA: hypothetical protein VG457_11505 [Planctomycetota bacterium]|jgi:hypothetical protein|nr:hypothetical protein [Planctomycetota bacterium]
MKTSPLVILFADRNPEPRPDLRVELLRRGAHVLVACSTGEAIHQAAHAPPDLLIADDDLQKDGQTDLVTFIQEALPKAEIILLRGSGPPTSSPSGVELLLWAHKHVPDQTLLETMEFAFPGRLGPPTPAWPRATQVRCVDEHPIHSKSLTWFVSPRGYQASGSRGRVGKATINFGNLHPPGPEPEGHETRTGLHPSPTPEAPQERSE